LTFETPDLDLTDPTKGFLQFVVYAEPRLSIASNSLNADITIEPAQTQTPHVQEWLSRLERCEPNALHCTLVEPKKIPKCAAAPATTPNAACPSSESTSSE
jgi:hypothetical protein